MDFIKLSILLIQIQVVTVSGALSPGPLTAATISSGVRQGWRAGLSMAIGHTIAEFPLVILIGIGITKMVENIYVHTILLAGGAAALYYFGYMQMKHSRDIVKDDYNAYNPVIMGFSLSLFNIYFIIWWLAIGSILIYEWIKLMSFWTIPLFYIFHVWMDYAWLVILSYMARLGVEKVGSRYIQLINIILGLILMGFGLYFTIDVINQLIIR